MSKVMEHIIEHKDMQIYRLWKLLEIYTTLDLIYEDQLDKVFMRKVEKSEYDRMWPMSHVDGVRLFPAIWTDNGYDFLTEDPNNPVHVDTAFRGWRGDTKV